MAIEPSMIEPLLLLSWKLPPSVHVGEQAAVPDWGTRVPVTSSVIMAAFAAPTLRVIAHEATASAALILDFMAVTPPRRTAADTTSITPTEQLFNRVLLDKTTSLVRKKRAAFCALIWHRRHCAVYPQNGGQEGHQRPQAIRCPVRTAAIPPNGGNARLKLGFILCQKAYWLRRSVKWMLISLLGCPCRQNTCLIMVLPSTTN